MEHFRQPHNQGTAAKATHQATDYNPVCGDEVTMTVVVKNNKLVDIRHQTMGCAVAIAAASLLTDEVANGTVDQALENDLEKLISLLGTPLTASRRQCAQVAVNALKKALLTSSRE